MARIKIERPAPAEPRRAGRLSPEDDLDPRESPSFYIKRIAQELTRLAEEELRPLKVGIGSLPVLTALKNGEASTQAELARLLRVEQSSMAQTLARLDRDGLIKRLPHPANKRVQRIELTPLAREILPKSKSAFLQGNRLAMAGFGTEEKRQFLDLIKRMHRNLIDSKGK